MKGIFRFLFLFDVSRCDLKNTACGNKFNSKQVMSIRAPVYTDKNISEWNAPRKKCSNSLICYFYLLNKIEITVPNTSNRRHSNCDIIQFIFLSYWSSFQATMKYFWLFFYMGEKKESKEDWMNYILES